MEQRMIKALISSVFVSTVLGASGVARGDQITVPISHTTSDCARSSQKEHRACVPGSRITNIGRPRVVSKNGDSRVVVGPRVDQRQPNCFTVTTRVTPLGEDCIRPPLVQPICNCKGRGWIHLEVPVTFDR